MALLVSAKTGDRSPMLSVRPAPLSADALLEPLCADCLAHEGLCRLHARGVLPAPLTTNWPVWLMGATAYQAPEPESPAAKRVRERHERKRARRADRLARALAGAHTRSRAAA